ncbi:Mei4 [Kluyveromyces lactis]|nr:Mei4 [Kluyveromyces lactis]
MLIYHRNPTWDVYNFECITLTRDIKDSSREESTQDGESLAIGTSADTKSSAVIHDVVDLLPDKEQTVKKSPHLDHLKPAFAFLRSNTLKIFHLRANIDVFRSLGERLDEFTISWIGKNYKRYRWLLGFSICEQYKYLVDCFQVVLLSYYSTHCDYKKSRRYLHETLFDRFITKEMYNRELYTKVLKRQFDISVSEYHLQNICSYHSKFLVRLVLLGEDNATKIRFACHVLYTMELLIKEKLLDSQVFWSDLKTGTDSAFHVIFQKRWEYLMKFGKRLTIPIVPYFGLAFRFCLQILSSILEHCSEVYCDGCNILQSKRYVQSELLMLKDKRFIAEFQMLDWAQLQDQISSTTSENFLNECQ